MAGTRTLPTADADRAGRGGGHGRRAGRRGAGTVVPGTLAHAVLAALAFVPLLVVDRGVVSSDTKTYLYLDPARFLGQVSSMWYPTVALGTVTHQYIGYLFPMGPYYALTAALHLHTWIAQRLWLGAILFAAGAGVLHLCRVLEATVAGPGRLVAALAYMLSPYLLQYSGRISVILLPWAALPWLVALAVRALRAQRAEADPGDRRRFPRLATWRHPALFALVVAAVSGINASSVLYVVLAPCLWLAWAVAVEHGARWSEALRALAKMALLTLAACAWWIVGLAVEAGYGVDVLRYTESVAATSSTSTPLEVLRGLGYWYFYGGGRTGPWTPSVVPYTKWLWLVALSFLVPVAAFALGAATRWRHRGYFATLVVAGTVLSVGAYPYAHPSAVGGALKAFMSDTTAGLAMRSTDRATPLVVLGLAALMGAGVDALWRSRPRAGVVTGALLCGLLVANNPALFNGDAPVDGGLTQPPTLPAYELAGLHALSSPPATGRVLAIPGDAFAAYTWGDTVDTPQPSVLTRPFVTREQQVMGSMATADTLYALDAPFQTSTENPAALAPMARLLSAGQVLVEYDQRSATYAAPQAVTLAERLARRPPGLGPPHAYGLPGQRVANPVVDAELLAGTPHALKPPPLVTYAVRDPRPLVRAEPDAGALVVAGDATALETLAADGLLDTRAAIYYAGTLDTRPRQLAALAARHATLVVSDTNRKQGFRWNSLSANAGQVETARGRSTTTTPSESPVDLFGPTPRGSRTVATYVGAADVTASSYGNPVTYAPEERPFAALDGDLRTAWETGTFVPNVDGQWWQVDFGHRVHAGHVTLVQPLFGTVSRRITEVTLTFTGRNPVTVHLGAASRRRAGQVVGFGTRSFRRLRVTIDATSSSQGRPVGFAEVRVPGRHVTEVLQLPTDLLHALGTRSMAERLVVSLARSRVSPYTTARSDPEVTLDRAFTLPGARTFTVSGTASLSPLLTDGQLDRLVGVPGSTGSGVVAFSSSRLTGALAGGAGAAAGGDPGVPWQSGFGRKDDVGAWLQYDLPAPVTVDRMALDVVTDRRHSVPASVEVVVTTPVRHRTQRRRLALPLLLRSVVPGTTTTVPLRFPAMTGTRVRVLFPTVHLKRGTVEGSKRTDYLPLGIASLGIPGLAVPAPPRSLPPACRSNLLRIDGRPLPVEVVGPTASALADGEVSVRPCGTDARGVHLAAGHHVIESTLATTPAGNGVSCAARGGCDGWNVDTLTLDSAPVTRRPAPNALGAAPAPAVRAVETSATGWTLHVGRAAHPFELVLGESVDAGWHAVAQPLPGAAPGARAVTLGSPELVDGFANGWPVTASDLAALGGRGRGGVRHPARFVVTLTWTPQRAVVAALAVSAAAFVACLVLVVLGHRRRRGPSRREPDGAPEPPTLRWTGAGSRRAQARSWSWWSAALVGVAAGAVAGSISDVLAGVGVALVVAAGLAVPGLRTLGGIVATGLLLAAVAMVVVGQAAHPAAGGGNWPGSYARAASVAAAAVAFLGADALVEVAAYARNRAGRRAGR